MNYRKNKIERLARVARLYYEEDRTQNEIAETMEVSRPLVSRMLREARDLGIVEIRVHAPECDTSTLISRLCQRYNLQGVEIIPDQENSSLTDHVLVKHLLQFIEQEQPHTLGVGWGAIIGSLSATLERTPNTDTGVQVVCPLIGNSAAASRQFHTDENVRIIANALNAQPKFLYAPAFSANSVEHTLLCGTSHYRTIAAYWEELDMALIDIHNASGSDKIAFPIPPNEQLAGHMLAYPFDQNGRILRSGADHTLHIPLETLTRCHTVVGLCASNVSAHTLSAALHTGILTHLFVRSSLIDSVLSDT